jgi:chemotaxis protein MotB
MQQQESLQIIKEQLKLKNKEIKKHEKEKALLAEKINNILQLNQQKLNELKAVITEKEDVIKQVQADLWAAKASKHVGIDPTRETKKEEEADNKDRPPPDDKLLEQMAKLKDRESELKSLLETRRLDAEKLGHEKVVLLKEVKRMRDEMEEANKLKTSMEDMKLQIKQLSGRSATSSVNMEQLIKEKDAMIASYEKMLYGSVAPGQEGMLPAEIIVELKEELETLEEERKTMIVELEQLKEVNEDLEMKLSFGEKKGGKAAEGGAAAAWGGMESREAQAAEFHMGLEKFLISYADLITLLLVMFIFLYSISKIDETKLAEAFGKAPSESTVMRLTRDELKMLDKIRELVKDNVDPDSIVRSDIRTILIRLNTSDLFAPGNSNFIDGADKVILDAIKDEMKEGVKQVLVDGHTDNVPIKSEIFPSNWELSAARASRVARFIMETLRFPPERLVVAGYGEHRPLEPNTNDEHRAMNRRVEIKILKDKEVAKEEKDKDGNPIKNKAGVPNTAKQQTKEATASNATPNTATK